MSDTPEETPRPFILWMPEDLCPNGLHPFEDCACEPCGSCEAVHTGPCSFQSAEAEDRATLGRAA